LVEKVTIGSVVKNPGNTTNNKTGGWRSFKPIMDLKICIRCGQCYTFCPEPAIMPKMDGENVLEYVIDYDFCKGCGICMEVCNKKAITMVPESK